MLFLSHVSLLVYITTALRLLALMQLYNVRGGEGEVREGRPRSISRHDVAQSKDTCGEARGRLTNLK